MRRRREMVGEGGVGYVHVLGMSRFRRDPWLESKFRGKGVGSGLLDDLHERGRFGHEAQAAFKTLD